MMFLVAKRIFDLILSSIALIVLTPVFILVSVILKATGEGEIFYFQKRPGINGKFFYLIKFATMKKNSLNIGNGAVTIKNDSRVLPVGRFLRKTKINEIPQIINVFIGHMSIVGPRPLPLQNFYIYTKKEQSIITSMKPGLTGVGSIFFRNEEEIIAKLNIPLGECLQDIIMPHKAKLEEWYYKNQSIELYLKIIFITAWVLLFPKSRIFNFLLPGVPKCFEIENLSLQK